VWRDINFFFFCSKWGCETTGHAYWNPSSAWNLITVKRGSDHDGSNQGERDPSKYPENGCALKNSPPGPCKGKYYNPLLIKFTEKGRQDLQSWLKGNRWGWQVYAPSRDPGFIFKIRLTVGDPAVAPIGPNKVLLEQPPPPSQIQTPDSNARPAHRSLLYCHSHSHRRLTKPSDCGPNKPFDRTENV
jgi:hypothetical protein